jgi:hypothetical protein
LTASTLAVTDENGNTVTRTIAFTKAVHQAILQSEPLFVDVDGGQIIKKFLVKLLGTFPQDTVVVKVTNNALDDSPVWQTLTPAQLNSDNFESFDNTDVQAGNWFALRLEADRGGATGDCWLDQISGIAGMSYIAVIGGDTAQLQVSLQQETAARAAGDDDLRDYIDEVQLSTQTWLPAVPTFADLPQTVASGSVNYLCRVMADPEPAKVGVWQSIANGTPTPDWTFFSDNADFVDELELQTALGGKQDALAKYTTWGAPASITVIGDKLNLQLGGYNLITGGELDGAQANGAQCLIPAVTDSAQGLMTPAQKAAATALEQRVTALEQAGPGESTTTPLTILETADGFSTAPTNAFVYLKNPEIIALDAPPYMEVIENVYEIPSVNSGELAINQTFSAVEIAALPDSYGLFFEDKTQNILGMIVPYYDWVNDTNVFCGVMFLRIDILLGGMSQSIYALTTSENFPSANTWYDAYEGEFIATGGLGTNDFLRVSRLAETGQQGAWQHFVSLTNVTQITHPKGLYAPVEGAWEFVG